MFDVQTTEAFDAWLDGLDKTAQRRLAARLRKLSCGLWGDAKPVGEGISAPGIASMLHSAARC
jgi:putative addiction module killer protein